MMGFPEKDMSTRLTKIIVDYLQKLFHYLTKIKKRDGI